MTTVLARVNSEVRIKSMSATRRLKRRPEKRKQPSYNEVCEAIMNTVPVFIALHYGRLSFCYAASVIGARILRSYGFEAKAVRAAAVIASPEAFALCGRATSEEILQSISEMGFTNPEVLVLPVQDGSALGHAVIQTHNQILDLTIGQVNQGLPGLMDTMSLRASAGFGEATGGNERFVCWVTATSDDVSDDILAYTEAAYEKEWHDHNLSVDCCDAVAHYLRTGDLVVDWRPGECAALIRELGFAKQLTTHGQ